MGMAPVIHSMQCSICQRGQPCIDNLAIIIANREQQIVDLEAKLAERDETIKTLEDVIELEWTSTPEDKRIYVHTYQFEKQVTAILAARQKGKP